MDPEIKICGLTSPEDARILNEYKVDYAGLVLFYSKSRRNVTVDAALDIMHTLDPAVRRVAVTVSPDPDQIRQIEAAGFDYIQIHGPVSQEAAAVINIPVWRAVNMTGDAVPDEGLDTAAGYVFDGRTPGGGEPFDWSVLKQYNRQGKLLILAGGLTRDNVGEGIRIISPDIVDVSSGVECRDRPGKDRKMVKEFIEAVRAFR